jgi:hypothetical protein
VISGDSKPAGRAAAVMAARDLAAAETLRAANCGSGGVVAPSLHLKNRTRQQTCRDVTE